MPLHRRFTARNALIVLLAWLFLVMLFHPRIGLLGHDKTPARTPALVLTKPLAPVTPVRPSSESEKGWDNTVMVEGGGVDGVGKVTGKMKGNGNGNGNGNGGKKERERRTAMVVARKKSEDAAWLEEYFPRWEKHIYRVDDAKAQLTVPKNKGRESMVYLTYIIDNYNSLPDNILFIHPNRYQWHNDDPDYDGLPMLRRFQLPYLESEGYVNIRCAWSLGCPAEIKPLDEEGEHRKNVHAGGDYKKAFQVLFPAREVPERVGVSCCAQFAATKEKILETSRLEYERLRNWLLETKLDDSISGRVLEYSWHMIFGKEAVHCPTAKECYCKVFGLCDLVCEEQGSCGHYTLPPFSTLPNGWPYVGWNKEQRSRARPED